ncbi:MAG: Nif3-like dinuclear metal center hexameric protein [Gemmatimonadetes bacterium]|nr:Nif3-like dinuclear metal center hexameric protein [Gemmatimonadota bacterium]
MKLESLLEYLAGYLSIADHPDYDTALNGLQVEGPPEVSHLSAAVDASEATIDDAARLESDLLLVHHGIFWGGLRPLTGPRFRRVKRLVEAGVGLYSAHLPLDGHPEVGNCILLARALGLEVEDRFGSYRGAPLGWWGTVDTDRDGLAARVEASVEGPVRLIPGGPERIRRVGVLTGGGGSFVEEAARMGLDAYVTGEGSHHTAIDATEMGINLLYAGHYRTETFGVRALGAHLSERFGLAWEFLDHPTGM